MCDSEFMRNFYYFNMTIYENFVIVVFTQMRLIKISGFACNDKYFRISS